MTNARLNGKRHTVDFLFSLSLLGVLAVTALLATLFGADIYENIIKHSESSYETGTSLAYVREKIRQNDTCEGITVTRREGQDVLAINSCVEGHSFLTCIYFQDGSLKELYQLAGESLPLSSGQTILSVSDFKMEQLSDTLFHFTAVDKGGESSELYVTVNSWQ